MTKSVHRRLCAILIVISLSLLLGCSSDEKSGPSGPPSSELMFVEYRNPVEIEVDPELQLALLLHDRSSPSGPALQVVDIQNHEVLQTLILDYYDVYDVEFINSTTACFAGRPQGNIGYAVEFFTIPSLTNMTRVLTGDTSGTHGYLDVNDAGTVVYYSHAGGGVKDAVYAISVANKRLIDADYDGVAPFGFDNDLVEGLLSTPSRIFFDAGTDDIVVANLTGDYITLIDAGIWGLNSRDALLIFPIAGTAHIETGPNPIPDIRADAVAKGENMYAFAGTSGETPYLSRFGTSSQGVDFVESFNDRQWVYRNRDIRIHPRQDIFSVFVLQEDTVGVGIGQFRLNNLGEVASSPYRTRHIPDSTIAAVGIDTANDRLLVADRESESLEFIQIIP
ncbi:hypothetical protein KKG66_00045 [bacterium]|nr:hypothetical protein [bacterium]